MLCESCGEYDANVHLTHVIEGVSRELHLCEDCASRSGINVEGSMSLTDIFMGLGPMSNDETAGVTKVCPLCGMGLVDFRSTSRLGCPVCYDTFRVELDPMLAGMHKGTKHAGKRPPAADDGPEAYSRLRSLEKDLTSAVAAENYEAAAKLRDEIHLQKTGSKA